MRPAAKTTDYGAPGAVALSAALTFTMLVLLALISPAHANDNEILGEIQFRPAGKVEKSAGIWVDGQYLGYLRELKDTRKVLLLPGRHEIKARLSGHLDFETEVDVVAGETMTIHVAMREKVDAVYPDRDTMAKVKLLVDPRRAAVFVNERYVGHVAEFRGMRKALGLAPGTYRIQITLPGYLPFETEMTLLEKQKYEIKTTLQKGKAGDDGLLSDTSAKPAGTTAENR